MARRPAAVAMQRHLLLLLLSTAALHANLFHLAAAQGLNTFPFLSSSTTEPPSTTTQPGWQGGTGSQPSTDPQITVPLVSGSQAYDPTTLGTSPDISALGEPSSSSDDTSSAPSIISSDGTGRLSSTTVGAESADDQQPQQPSTELLWDIPEGRSCSLNPAVDPEPQYCEPGLVCYPRWRPIYTTSSSSITGSSSSSSGSVSPPYSKAASAAAPGTQPDAFGICADPQAGVLLPRAYPTPWPTPAAYYPLTQGYDSFAGGQLSGTFHRTTFDTSDRRWGSALTCDAAAASFAALQPPNGLGEKGSLAVSIWIKLPVSVDSSTDGNSGSGAAGYQYVLSLTQAGSTGSSRTNQVSIMVPCQGHPKFGTVRAVIRDGNDATVPETWLDSDGSTSSSSRTTFPAPGFSSSFWSQGVSPVQNPNRVNLWDGEWHHVVVSSIQPVLSSSSSISATDPSDNLGTVTAGWRVQRGYRLFVNGLMRAELRSDDSVVGSPSNSSSSSSARGSGSTGDDNSGVGVDDVSFEAQAVSGGDSATLDGLIYLCSRADRDPLLYFTGQLAQLQVFSEALSQSAVSSLYMEFRRQALIHPKGEIMPGGAMSSTRHARCLMPVSYAGQLQYQCLVLPNLGTDSSGSSTSTVSGGPACLTGPRGEWEPCSTTDSSTTPQYVAVHDVNDSAAVAAVLAVAVDVDGSAAGVATNSTTSSTAAGTTAGPDAVDGSTLSEAVQARLAAAVGSTVYSYSHLLPRYTMSGQACMTAPHWFQGKLVQAGQCTSFRGQEVCPVPKAQVYSSSSSSSSSSSNKGEASVYEQYNMLQCDPLVAVPAFSTYCYIAAEPNLPGDLASLEDAGSISIGSSSSSSSSGGGSSSFEVEYSSTQTTGANAAVANAALLFEGCVSQGGLEFCKVRGKGGPWLLCPAGASPQSSLSIPCQLPFRYGSTARTDCAAPMPSPSPVAVTGTAAADRSLYCPLQTDSNSSSGDDTTTQVTSTDDMSLCRASFSAATIDPEGSSSLIPAAAAAASSAISSALASRASMGYMGDPTAAVPGLPDFRTVLLNGLVSNAGTGARRYSLYSRQACQPFSAPGLMQSDPVTASSSSDASILGRRGGRFGSVDGASESASPAAGVASCIVNADRGRFECYTGSPNPASLYPPSSSSSSSSSIDTNLDSQWEVCAPVVRTTITGNSCYLPFKWQGSLRDDCVWHNGMEICPVLATASVTTTTTTATASAMRTDAHAVFPPLPRAHGLGLSGLSATDSSSSSSGGSSGSSIAELAAVSAGGAWRWEQCSRDYVTKWEQPPANKAPAQRFALSATSCIFPIVYDDQIHWDCINGTFSSSSDSSSSSSGSSVTDSSTTAGQYAISPEHTLGVCALPTGQWEVCAPQPDNVTRYTLDGGTCNLPFTHNGSLHYDCVSASNGTAGLCKDTAGTWRSCVALNRRGKTSGKPCILPALLSAKDGLVSAISTAADGRQTTTTSSSNDATSIDTQPETGTGKEEDGDEVGPMVVVTDCFWQLRPSPAQQENPLAEVCYTDPNTIEECTPSDAASSLLTQSAQNPTTSEAIQKAATVLANTLRAAPKPTTASRTSSSSSSSKMVPLAVGIAVGIGGALLLLAVLMTVAVKRGLVYQWRSNRFHEMQLDPDVPGCGPSTGFGSYGGGLAAGFMAAKEMMSHKMTKPQQGLAGSGDSAIIDAALGIQQMDGYKGLISSGSVASTELVLTPSKRQKLASSTSAAAAAAGSTSPGTDLESQAVAANNKDIFTGSSSNSSKNAGPHSVHQSTPFAAVSAGFSKAGSLLQRLLSSSSSSTASGFLLPSASHSGSATYYAPSDIQTPSHPGAATASTIASGSGTTGDSAWDSSSSSSGGGGRPSTDKRHVIELLDRSKSSTSGSNRSSSSSTPTSPVSVSPRSTGQFSVTESPRTPPQPAAAAGLDAHEGSLNPFEDSAAAAAAAAATAAANFSASHRPCYQAQLTGVSTVALTAFPPLTPTPAADSTAARAAAGDEFGVEGAVGTARHTGSSGSVVGARILHFTAAASASLAARQAGGYAAWDGGKADADTSASTPPLDGPTTSSVTPGSAAAGDNAAEPSGCTEAETDSDTDSAPPAAAAAGASKLGAASKLSKLLHPVATRQQEEVEAAARLGKEVAATAASEPPGAAGGTGLL